MFNSQIPNAHTTGTGQLRLMAWAYAPKVGTIEAEILEANAETQTAQLRTRGGTWSGQVNFSAIQCVSLKWDNGIVEQCFGAPKIHKVESNQS